jgi:hypothetical protein
MRFEGRLALLPHGSRILSESIAVHVAAGQATFFNQAGPILVVDLDNREEVRLAAVYLMDPELGFGLKTGALAEILGVHRATVRYARRRHAERGIDGLREEKRGPKGAHKLAGDRLKRAQKLLDAGLANTVVAEKIAVTEGAIRLALRQERLRRPAPRGQVVSGAEPSRPRARNDEDVRSPAGVAVKRHVERGQASLGLLQEAAPRFVAAESVSKAGVLLALPAVVSQGLYAVGKEVYFALRPGFFGLRATLSTLVFMALLRIKNAEQLTTHAPGEFGHVLGLDRAPEMKTLRRKLRELGERKRHLALKAAFLRRWAEDRPGLLGFLYVDGHVRPYNGRTHELPKTRVARRRLCMPATTDYWVNDAAADPLFCVTAPANEGLLAMLEEAILPDVRGLVGERRVTLVMDRECWSPKRFKAWWETGFDVMTYRKGEYERWPEEIFSEHVSARDARKKAVVYKLAERPLVLSGDFEVREVRCLTDDGHQSSVVTTRRDLSAGEVAERMFSRWRQENFFRYMRHEFALDHLPTHNVEPADAERPVPNPERKRTKKKLGELRRQLGSLKKTYGHLVHEDAAEDVIERVELRIQIEAIERRIILLRRDRKSLPSHVPAGELHHPESLVQLERERKIITDVIKTVGYRAETDLADLVRPLLGSHEDEARSFLRQAFQLSADLMPDEEEGTLRVRLHSMANWRSNRTLDGLCILLNSYGTRYPGTDLRLVFEAPYGNYAELNSAEGQVP